MSAMPAGQLIYCVCGLIAGLVVAFLASTLVARFKPAWVVLVIDVILYIAFGYLGWSAMSRRKGQFPIPAAGGHGKAHGSARPKLLDTSVIIDGRIAEICDTGIIEGEIIVPSFVLRELQHIADSSDGLRRNRGRRGLDILKGMQDKKSVPITVVSTDYKDVDEVDAKLILMASELGGVVVTNDYNLNKVAAVRKVPVFNINELANALKPIAMPGEEMSVFVVKEGKEAGQGIGYMDDGTMIVIENGRRLVGETVDVTVTSVLQTSAGRMIFARVKQA
ncbi:MAG: PIN/TRAM domain-containing protein [Christensenellales bacterium]